MIAVVSAIFSTPLNLLLKLIFERSILPPIKVWTLWAFSDLANSADSTKRPPLMTPIQDAAFLAYEKEQRASKKAKDTLWNRFFGPRRARVYVLDDELPEEHTAIPAKPEAPRAPLSPAHRVAKQLVGLQQQLKQTQVQWAQERRKLQQ